MTAVLDAAAPASTQPRRAVPADPEPETNNRVVIPGLSWRAYQLIGEALLNRPGIHLTYDCGRLEIMTLSPEHESGSSLLNRLLEILAEEMNLPMKNLGSTTFQREDL